MFAFYPPHHSNYVYTPYQPRFYKPVSPIARSRNESYYAPTTPMYDLVTDLNEQEQRRRAQEAVQQQQERHERENQARQRAYRQWLHEKKATREAMKPFEQRTPPHLCPSNNDINLNKSPRIRRIPIQS
ncbi:3355_t:CDS:1, partial [Ambispora gerdemannii]